VYEEDLLLSAPLARKRSDILSHQLEVRLAKRFRPSSYSKGAERRPPRAL
jgi:hypothetical protein